MNSIRDALTEALKHPILEEKRAVKDESYGILWVAAGAIGLSLLLHLTSRGNKL